MRRARKPEAFVIDPEADTSSRFASDRICNAMDCDEPGAHRAPKNRDQLNDYYWFCLEHVRVYNARWDYFKDMDQDQIEAVQAADNTWHRPTWRMGEKMHIEESLQSAWARAGLGDGKTGSADGETAASDADAGRHIGRAERKALNTLELDESATPDQIRIRYTELVKRYHPDANEGDRRGEQRLQQVIQAYSYLRSRAS